MRNLDLDRVMALMTQLLQLYRYTPEIFLFSTATFKYKYQAPFQTNWTRIFSESRFFYFSVTNKWKILRRSEEGVKGRCLPWSKEEEGAYMENWPVDDPGNYRSMSLVSHIGKLFTSTINTRLMKWSEDNSVLTDAQCESRFFYFSVTNKWKILRRSEEGVKGRCLPWSKEEEGAYIFWMK
jgi:hypothetical protein